MTDRRKRFASNVSRERLCENMYDRRGFLQGVETYPLPDSVDHAEIDSAMHEVLVKIADAMREPEGKVITIKFPPEHT